MRPSTLSPVLFSTYFTYYGITPIKASGSLISVPTSFLGGFLAGAFVLSGTGVSSGTTGFTGIGVGVGVGAGTGVVFIPLLTVRHIFLPGFIYFPAFLSCKITIPFSFVLSSQINLYFNFLFFNFLTAFL